MVANVGECEANPTRNGRECVRISRECVRTRREFCEPRANLNDPRAKSVLTLARALSAKHQRLGVERSAFPFVCRVRRQPACNSSAPTRDVMRMCENVARTRGEDPANVCEYFANPRDCTRTGAET